MNTRSSLAVCLLLIVLVRCAAAAAAEPRHFWVSDFGGAGDEKTDNTRAVARAIEAAGRAEAGGVVHVGSGKWICGAIELRSGVTLQLDNGANLLMSTNPADYPVVLTRWEGIECYNYGGLIRARGATRIAIRGKGTIEGRGEAWWRWYKSAGPARRRLRELGETTDGPGERVFGTPSDALRPSLIQFIDCDDVTIEGVTIKNAPMWTVHPIECRNVVCRDLYILGRGPNTDGIDPESCRDVLIQRCTIDTGDDCIAIKSGRDRDGRRTGRPCENVTVRDCTIQRGSAGIAIGSETSGGIRNVNVVKCTMRSVRAGVRIKTMRGRGGAIEDVNVADVRMQDVGDAAIEVNLRFNDAADAPAGEATPIVRNVTFRDIDCLGAKRAAVIRGLGESAIEGLTIRNAKLRADEGIWAEYASAVELANVELWPKDGAALHGEHLADWVVDGLKAGRAPERGAVVWLKDVAGVTIRGTPAPEKTDVLVRVEGAGTREVQVVDCDASRAVRKVEAADDVPEGAVEE